MADLQNRNINSQDFLNLSSAKERIEFLLQYAVLAPSTHNSQPWQFRIGDDFCEVLIHDEHPIVYADPLGRDLHISFGCLIENLAISAEYFGVLKKIEYVLRKPSLAKIYFDFSNPQTKNELKPLLDAIPGRVNARGLFEQVPIDQESQQSFEKLQYPSGLSRYFLKNKEQVMRIGELTQEGLVMAYNDPRFRKEMAEWFNSSVSKRPIGIPGYSLRMPFLLSFVFAPIVRSFNIGKKLGELNYRSIISAPEALVITAKENDPRYWLDTGRLAQRFILTANIRGYKTSFFTAAIEMGELYKDIQKLLNTVEIPQFIIIFGKMDYYQKPNLRHSAKSRIVQ
jgi:hypothetical protein